MKTWMLLALVGCLFVDVTSWAADASADDDDEYEEVVVRRKKKKKSPAAGLLS